MLDYKAMIRLKKLGLNNTAIANNVQCKWDSVQRIISRCENIWGSIEGVPTDLSNDELADILFSSRKIRSCTSRKAHHTGYLQSRGSAAPET